MVILGIPVDAWLAFTTGLIGIGITLVAMFIKKKKKFELAALMNIVKDSVDLVEDLKEAYDKENKATKRAERLLGKNLTKKQKKQIRRKILRDK